MRRSRSRFWSLPPVADTKGGLTGSSRVKRRAEGRTRSRGRWAWAVITLFIVSSVGIALAISPGMQRSHTNYDLHSIILIDSDAELQDQAIAEGWQGDGSEIDPFVIEGYEVAAVGYDCGIYVGNTSMHLIVEDCYVHDATYSCISLLNVTNVTVVDTDCANSQKCIEVAHSSLVNLIANNCTMAFGSGIDLLDCERSSIIGNNCSDNLVGFSVEECGNVSLQLNSAHDNVICGLQLHLTTGSALANNTCTGGQFGVYLLNCGWVTVNDTEIDDCSYEGLTMAACHECSAERNRCSGHGGCGISIEDSTGCRVLGNHVSDSGLGIGGLRCEGCEIRENECTDNDGHGIRLEDGERCALEDNHCEENGGDGVGMVRCLDSRAEGNTCTRNGGSGLRCDESERCDIGRNTCSDNGGWGIRCVGLVQGNITENDLNRSGEDGIGVSGCTGVTVSDNNCSSARVGLHFSLCNAFGAYNNTIDDCVFGVSLSNSVGAVLRGNLMARDGIHIDGPLPEHWDTHEIGPTNLVNGLPVLYAVSAVDLAVTGAPGQVILVECVNVTVNGLDLSNATIGVASAFSSEITISGCTCSDGYAGIYLQENTLITVEDVDCSRNARSGIEAVTCDGLEVTLALLVSNVESGVRLRASEGTEVVACEIGESNFGISVEETYAAGSFVSNSIWNCRVGIGVETASNLQLHVNEIAGCDYGVNLVNSQFVAFVANAFTGCGLHIEASHLAGWNSHVVDPGNSVNGRALVYLVGASGVTMDPFCGQAVFVDCSVVEVASLNLTACTVGVLAGFSDHVNVVGCNLSDNWIGVEFAHSHDGLVESNMILDCENSGVMLLNSTGNLVLGNEIANSSTGIDVRKGSSDSSHNTLLGNKVSDSLHGLMMTGAPDSVVSHNMFTGNLASGVLVTESDRVFLLNNSCIGSGDMALGILGSDGCNLVNNTCSVSRLGICLSDSSGCNLTGNMLYGSEEYGVCLDSACSGNTVWNNVFAYNNGTGESYDPLLFQARDDGSGNRWNSSDGPTQCGNYWHDWTVPDIDMDGVVDVPYNISGAANAKDYYPLADTSEIIEPIPEFGVLFVLVALAGVVLGLVRRRRD